MKRLSLLFALVLATCLVFTVSCVGKQVPVTETYYETEYRPITGTLDLTPQVKWCTNLYGDSTDMEAATGNCWTFTPMISYYGYEISTDQHSESHVKVFYSYIGPGPFHPLRTYLYVHDLTGVGQIVLPTDFELGQSSGQYQKTRSIGAALVHREGIESYKYVPTLQEQEWLKWYHSIVGTSDISWPCLPEKARRLLASFSTPDMCYIDPGYTPRSGGLTDAGVALLGPSYKYNCSITFDTSKVKEFAIITRTEPGSNIFCTSLPDDALSTFIEVSSVQLIWTDIVTEKVEKQRTVTQTKKVPFWEAIFGE